MIKSGNGKVRQVMRLVNSMSSTERRELITGLNGYGRFWEDLQDILIIRQRAREPRIPYQKIRARLKKEGRI